MPLLIHHYFPLGSTNIGDRLVARAIRQAITKHFGPAEFVDMPVNDRYRGDRPIGLRGTNFECTNHEADLVIVGGSNLLEPRKTRRGPDGARRGACNVFTDPESIRELRPPLLLLGMGTGSSFGKRIRRYEPPALQEVQALHEKAMAAAVRDVTTARKLAEIGVSVPCVGCPVTFLTDEPVQAQDADLPLMVSFPPPRIVDRFGGRAFMTASMRYIQWLRDQQRKIIVTLHDSQDIEPARRWTPPGVEIFWTDDLDELIARFQNSRGVIGFRLHAALLGLGLGKPVIPVGVDWRGLAFIQTFGLQDLSIRPFRFRQFAKLRTLTDRLLNSDAEMIHRQARAKAKFLSAYHDFLEHAAEKFRVTSAPRTTSTPYALDLTPASASPRPVR